MAGKNERAATLPSSLRHGVPHSEENEGFFTKLRKKFKLKKGRYHVDVSTGECENIAAVSFKKRESREILDDESPRKLSNPKYEGQESPKLSKQSLNEKHSLSLKGKERKLSNPETYTRTLNSSEINTFQRSSFGGKIKSTNEYSPLTYDTKENVTDRSLKLRESALKNDCVLHDDSAIDLDTDVENVNKAACNLETTNLDTGLFDPGYEKLPGKGLNSSKITIENKLKKEFDPNYESVQEVQEKLKSESDFDPNYETVDEVKARNKQVQNDEFFNIEDDPGYQCVKDVKRLTSETGTGGMRPAKTYSMNQSIESLDEPGYESLNDVKKRITEQNFAKSGRKMSGGDQLGTKTSESVNEVDDFNDSAIGSVPKSDSLLQMDLPENRPESANTASEVNGGLQAFTEAVVSLTGFATALTGSGTSKDSGFESKDRSIDLEQEENLYSSVRKSGIGDGENPYSTVNKDKKETGSHQQVETVDTYITGPEIPVGGYDSDTELMLDPGYAECADAIKGVIPYSLYSEGSGSKMSSCTSLDLSAEDFILEPGYAECADAIKSGAIKKISVSHERLVDHTVGGKHEDKGKGEISSEIYANPQILFRKRSKLIEDESKDSVIESSGKMEASEETKSPEEEICLAVDSNCKKKEKKPEKKKEVTEVPSEAPPLPARNYSLYLDSEEAEQIVQEVLQDCASDQNVDISILDDAFETVDQNTKQIEGEQQTNIELKQTSFCVEEQIENDREQIENDRRGEKSEKGREDTQNVSDKSRCQRPCEGYNIDISYAVPCLEYTEDKQRETTTVVSKQDQACKDESVLNSTGTEVFNTNNTNMELTGQIESAGQHLSPSKCDEKQGENSFSYDENKPFQENILGTNDETKFMENCLHVIVKDEMGLEKILKVVEKQESFQLQRKRESSRKKTSEGNKEHEHDCVDEQICRECERLTNCTDKGLQQTKCTTNLKTFTPNSTYLQETKACLDLASQESPCKDVCMHTGCDTDYSRPPFSLKNLEESASIDIDEDYILKSGNIDMHESSTTDFQYHPSEPDTSNFLTVAVKMKSVSVDSDSDFFNTEDLPKLEINESDLESPFDSSDNSNNLDIETESESINKLTEKLNTEDIPDSCSKNFKLQTNVAQDESSEFKTGQTNGRDVGEMIASRSTNRLRKDLQTEHIWPDTQVEEEKLQCSLVSTNEIHLSEREEVIDKNDREFTCTYQNKDEVFDDVVDSQTGDRKATLNSRLCVVDSEKESECDLSILMDNYCADAVTDVNKIDQDLSDDSAIGNVDDFHPNEFCIQNHKTEAHNFSGASHQTTNLSESTQKVTDNVSSQELHLIYEKEHPNLYEDTEPTHMSLQEAMGLSPQSIQVTESYSDSSSGHVTKSPNTFVHSNIPRVITQEEPAITAPPRPPPLASMSHSVGPDLSGESKSVTPIDEVPSLFSLSEADSPPVIPPRQKAVRTPRRPVSYSHDFMESMRQLKDHKSCFTPMGVRQNFLAPMKTSEIPFGYVRNCGWYWGPLSWEEAEHKLAKKPEGTFLVRDSSDEHYILSLSFKNQGRVHHTRIEHHKGHFSFWSQPDSHGKSTIKEFIEQCVENSRNGRFLYFIRPSGPGSPPMPIQLLNPVSRFVQMRSLQHMCRFRILQLVRRDHIDHLPVPTRIKQYLKEAQYYVEYLDD